MISRLAEAFRRAIALEAAGQLDEAEVQCTRILGIEPDHAHAMHMLGLVAARRRRHDLAVGHVEAAIATAPEPLFLRTLAEIERRRNNHDRALALARQAIAGEPGNHLNHVLEGAVLRDLLRLDEAMACQRRALVHAPDHPEAHFELAKSLLLLGRFAEGWAEHEWRFRIAGAVPLMPPTACPAWDGQPLRGTLLLIADQGFGDVIQFARYIPWAAGHADDLAVACSPEMMPVLARMYPGLRLFTRWRDQPDFAAVCPLSGLPRLHGTMVDTIPKPPDLHPDPDQVAAWQARLAASGQPRIGIVWAGRPTHSNDFNRSATLDLFAEVATRPVTLVSLQQGPATVADYRGAAPLIDLGPELQNFLDTAAVIACLDLVITVDTAVAHLAGTLGRPVWIALPHAPDWRWLIGRSDTPWYPTARLFRQPAPGRWDAVASALAAALPP